MRSLLRVRYMVETCQFKNFHRSSSPDLVGARPYRGKNKRVYNGKDEGW